MNILALDTSSQAASCALLRDDRLIGEFFINTAFTHSQTILPMVQSLLTGTGTAMAEIDLFAVATGPGSFTGLRIGISAVKGMAMAAGAPCAAVPTLAALAENLAAVTGYILPVMDARRSQVYTALFHCEGGAVRRVWDDAAMAIDALGERVQEELGGAPVMLVGDGATLCAQRLAQLDNLQVAPENLRHQRAGSVARAAAGLAAAGKTCTAADLVPAYLRLPQAERERLAKLQVPEV